MLADTRKAYLDELGLTLWRRRPVGAGDLPPPLAGEGRGGGAPLPPPAVMRPPAEVPQPTFAAELATLDWDALEAHLAQQDCRGASRAVFGVGARDADLLIVGEAPGAQEDRLGEPFVGRAGKLLDRMLFAIGRDRASNAYIANICKFRPPNNRDPNAEEVAADRPYLERQIALLSPRLIVAVGRIAAQTLLGSGETLASLRGSLHHYLGVPVLVTYHPAYLLRSPQHKDHAWADLKRARALLAQAA